MAKGQGNQFKSKPAGKFALTPGPSGKMQKFTPVGNQPADTTAVKNVGGSKAFAKPNAGGSGKMQKFLPVKGQKPGRTSQA